MDHNFIVLQLNRFGLTIKRERDKGLITLCHSCRFTCQQRLLKNFAGPSSLLSKDGVV